MTTYDGVQHRMAQWIRRLPTEQKIQGSNPCAVIYFFLPFPGKGKGVATLPASSPVLPVRREYQLYRTDEVPLEQADRMFA